MINMFIDATKCIGCKACQVACKNWNSLPAETTTFTGKYTNPPDYSGSTLTYVEFTEFKRNGKLNFLFFKNQCRHCIRPKCQRACPKGVDRTSDGIILFNDDCTIDNVRIRTVDSTTNLDCPFDVPRYNSVLDKFVKCDLCFDRLGNGEKTACELTCPSGAIVTGTDADMRLAARNRLKAVKNNPAGTIKGNRYASLYSGNYGRTNVIYLLAERPRSYGLGLPRGN